MSYLHRPRVVFAGDFQADVSTVNNDVRHYDNASFQRRFQELPQGQVQNGWWNPSGGSVFALVDCRVRGVVYADGTGTADPAREPLIGKPVDGPADQSLGKLVDLDPQMQMCSELWGIRLRIDAEGGGPILEGDLLPSPFRDLQTRQIAQQSQNGQPLGACWTSVLSNLQWGSFADETVVLRELRDATDDGLLAVHLTAFGYYYAHNDGRFSFGRLLGAIGPYRRGEPRLFPAARRLVGTPSTQVFSYSNFAWDGGWLTLDLGGSFPIVDPQGTVADAGALRVAVARIGDVPIQSQGPTRIKAEDRALIGEVHYDPPRTWLATTGGVVDYQVSGDAATLLDDHQLLLLADGDGGDDLVLAAETLSGLAVRADQEVQRLDPGETARVDLYAWQWGRPLANARISLALARPSRPGGGSASDPDPPVAPIPFTNLPADALTFPRTLATDADGRAVLEIEGRDPDNPRRYLEGQIYQIVYQLDGLPRSQQYFLDQVIVHLRDAFTVPDRPTWEEVRPILTQFGNLYPIMSRHIVDLSDQRAVLDRREILLHAFTRPIHDPAYMPVTRDLSAAQLATVVRWLQQASAAEGLEVETRALAAAEVPVPVEPKTADMARLPAMIMGRSRFEEMTRGEGGKIDALKGARDAFELMDGE